MEFSQKPKDEVLDDPATPPLGIYLEDIQVKITQTDTCTQVFSAALDRATQVPPAWEKTRKLGLFSAIEKEQSHAICRKMDAMWDNHIISENIPCFLSLVGPKLFT